MRQSFSDPNKSGIGAVAQDDIHQGAAKAVILHARLDRVAICHQGLKPGQRSFGFFLLRPAPSFSVRFRRINSMRPPFDAVLPTGVPIHETGTAEQATFRDDAGVQLGRGHVRRPHPTIFAAEQRVAPDGKYKQRRPHRGRERRPLGARACSSGAKVIYGA